MKIIKYLVLILLLASDLVAGEWVMVDSVFTAEHYAITYQGIACADINNCIAAGDFSEYIVPTGRVTTDGGKTWATTYYDTTVKPYYLQNTFAITYPDTNICLVLCDSSVIRRSTDKGKTWTKTKFDFKTKILYNGFTSLKMINKDIGYVRITGLLYSTQDGGKSWNKINIPFPDSANFEGGENLSIPEKNIIKIVAYKKIAGFIEGLDDYVDFIMSTEDNCKTWDSYEPMPRRITNIFFKNKDEGWALGLAHISPSSSSSKDIILHTNDGGKSWNIQLDTVCGKVKGLKNIYFSDINNGIAWGVMGNIWRTNNGGKQWILDTSFLRKEPYLSLISIAMPETNILYGVEDMNGKIYKYSVISGIHEKDGKKDDFEIFPNPVYSTSDLNIKFYIKNFDNLKFTIYNYTGEKVGETYRGEFTPGEHTLRYEGINELPAGMYLLRIEGEGLSITKPFVIIK